jgi:hypothetical protein
VHLSPVAKEKFLIICLSWSPFMVSGKTCKFFGSANGFCACAVKSGRIITVKNKKYLIIYIIVSLYFGNLKKTISVKIRASNSRARDHN